MPSFTESPGEPYVPAPYNNIDRHDVHISTEPSVKHERPTADPIAIVGMAMRLPGRVHNGEEFWKMMTEKRNGLCEVPQDRYNVGGFHDPSGKPGTFQMDKGYFLQDVDIQQFDTSFFSVSKTELERLDPQQRQLLEVTYECMEDSGATSWRGSNIGCYVGVFGDDWQDLNAKEPLHRGGYRVTGYDDFVLGNRVSYEYDLHGPSMTVKTGCSSSLVCLDMACEAIRKGDCDGALVCGTGLIFSPTMTLALSDQGVLSPSGVSQEALIRRAYAQAGIADLSKTAMVECHGTGTSVGDPLETAAVARCFGDKGIIITSVKPNVGHSEGAAGLTSLIKAVLAIEHRQIPPNIFFETPNPETLIKVNGHSNGKIDEKVNSHINGYHKSNSCTNGHSDNDIDNSNSTVNGKGTINGNGTVKGSDNVNGNGTVDSACPVNGNGSINGNSTVKCIGTINGSGSVNGNGAFNGDGTMKSNGAVNGNGTISGNGTVNCNNTVNGVANDTANGDGNTHHANSISNGNSNGVLNGAGMEKGIGNGPENINGHGPEVSLEYAHMDGKGSVDAIVSNGNGSVYGNGISRSNDRGLDHSLDEEFPLRPQLLLFSASGDSSLKASIEEHQNYLAQSDASLKDIAYTLALRREHKSHRAYAIAANKNSLDLSPSEHSNKAARIAWVFTGQGAQWPEMGAQLIDSNLVFRSTIDKLDNFLRGLPAPPSWTIKDELRKAAGKSRVQKAEMGHPLSIAVQVALVDVLRSWNIQPDIVLGHSSGETAAAYACGAITAEAAMAIGTFRGTNSTQTSDKRGSMAAIGLGPHEMAPYMESGVVVACENSQCSVTVSGDTEQVEKVVQNVKEKQPGVLARMLRVERAFHSHHMLENGPQYEEHLLPFVTSVSPVVPFYSSVTGKRLTGDGSLGPAYWRKNMESPVLFNTALRSALAGVDGKVAIVEIGPHPALKGPIGQILRDLDRGDDVHMGTLQRDKIDEESMLHLAGKLFQHGVDVDYSAVGVAGGSHVRNMPRYSWKRDTAHWAESRMTREWRFREHAPHELLGSRVLEVSNSPFWRNKLALEDAPWLSGHEVNGQVIFPGAGYICMVGEAIRQLEGDTTYSLRNVKITAGLVLDHGKTVELVTSITPISSDSSDESPWYTFGISSHDGTRWINHCAGEARASVDKSVDLSAQAQAPLPRKVEDGEWYGILNRVGFNYTGLFQGLRNISSATDANLSTAAVPFLQTGTRGNYAMHPATIDQCFQLFTVSAYRGLGRNCKSIAVPTFIEGMIVRPTTDDLDVVADIGTLERGSFVGNLTAQSNGEMILSLRGFKASALTREDDADENLPLITQFEWKPHADFLNLKDHMHPRTHIPREWSLFEELMILCIIDHVENIRLTEETQPHLRKFLSWMQEQLEKYKSGANVFVSNETRLWELTREQRLSRIEEIVIDGEKSQYPAFCIAIHRLFKAVDSIFEGKTHPLHVLMKDDILTDFYAVGDELEYADALQALGHTNPRLRILEVGAGTGGTTVKVLKALKSRQGERLFGSYTYTDISTGFMAAAKERFADVENIEYAALDISQSPVEQGFQEGGYDLIVASNVIHATPCLQTSLLHLRTLLSPGGRLFLQELCPDAKYVNYVMGYLSGWWLGDDDNRSSEPYISPERWTKELVAAGFQEPAIAIDGIAPYQQSAGIMAVPAITVNKPPRVTLVTYTLSGAYVREAKDTLEARGMAVDVCLFGSPLPAQDAISLLDLQEAMVHGLTKDSFESLVAHLNSINAKLVWATRPSQVNCEDPRTAMTLGLARTARSELSVKLFTVEIDTKITPSSATEALVDVLMRVQSPELDADSMDPDWEFAVVGNRILVPRMHWQTMSNAFSSTERASDDPSLKYLTVKTPGLLHTMGWSEVTRTPLGHGQVLVQTKAIGLNFRDVLIALGVLDNSPREIGLEGCGIITEVGPGVQKFAIGDRVMYMSSGCFTTHIALSQTLCVKIDDSLSFEQGAALPCVYATATMALTDKANLKHGQSILIHSACGGVGLAAIQIAQMLGAEVYCTVGNDEKIQYLIEQHKIPRSHIFNSRDSSFLGDVMRATNDRGVDVVLNSLAGELLQASWKCVAEFGTMIEIGKRDFRRRAKLSMEAFEANRTFVGLDLWQVSQVRPEKAAELLERCVRWIRDGALNPGVIAKVFEAGQIQDAFRFMQGGRHIGKIIVAMPDDPSSVEAVADRPAPSFRSDRSYLLVGGLGGLGRAIAMWMVEQGARHLVFLSRSAKVKPELQGFMDELQSQGCEVQLAAGSVSNVEDVEKAVQAASRPIAGVMNLSMVLKDVSLSDMSFDDWTTAVAPKVQGTWNLHNAITSELDFFILCSSYSGIVGQWGQANYSAANTFLDAFVQFRHRNGLAASVIDIGVMGEVGFVSKNKDILDRFQKSGMRILKEQDLLDATNLAIQRSRPINPRASDGAYTSPGQILLGLVTTVPIASPNNRVVWKKDVRMSIYHNINGAADASAKTTKEQDSVGALLAAAASDPAILEEQSTTTIIATAIASALANFLIKEEGSIKIEHSPENAGLDSLVAMELRNWIRQKFSVETTVMTIVQSPSLLNLGDLIRVALVQRA
ncbi:hypothetical protein RJ55_04873 [Drechmeria coniospora]|nr:hypothetical protein RJ55_04873 [Drechmeria coniospora]